MCMHIHSISGLDLNKHKVILMNIMYVCKYGGNYYKNIEFRVIQFARNTNFILII